jgi:predicted deacylase
VKSPALGLWYPAISCGDSVKKGQILGEICDLFGESLATLKAGHDGLIVFLLTSLAVNEGDSLLSVAHSEEV